MNPKLFAIALSLTFIFIPQMPAGFPTDTAEEGAFHNYAMQQHLRFGPEMTYSCGPANTITHPFFTHGAFYQKLAINAVLCYVMALGISLVAWRLTLGLRIAFLAFFLFVPATWMVSVHRPDLLMITALFSWGILCFEQPENPWRLATLAVLSAFFALTRNTYIISGTATIGFLAWKLGRRAPMLVGAYLCAILVGWMLCGQRIQDFTVWLTNAFVNMTAYNSTGATEPARSFLVIIALVAALAVPFALQHWRYPAFMLWLLFILFITWKQAVVRSDGPHHGPFFGFMPLFALALLPQKT